MKYTTIVGDAETSIDIVAYDMLATQKTFSFVGKKESLG